MEAAAMDDDEYDGDESTLDGELLVSVAMASIMARFSIPSIDEPVEVALVGRRAAAA